MTPLMYAPLLGYLITFIFVLLIPALMPKRELRLAYLRRYSSVIPKVIPKVILSLFLIGAVSLSISGCGSAEGRSEAESGGKSGSGDDLDLNSAENSAEANPDGAPSELATDEIVSEDLTDPGAGKGKSSSASASAGAAAPNEALSEPPPADNSAPVESMADSNAGNGQEVTINDIRYVSKQNGGTVVVDTSGPASYHTREVPEQNQVIIEISNARLPDRLKRPYVTKDFKQSIDAINAYQNKGSSTARVVIQFKEPTHTIVAQSGKTLTIASQPGGGGDSGAVAQESSANPGSANENVGSGSPEDDFSESSTSKSQAATNVIKNDMPTSSLDTSNPDNMHFYGRPISLEFSDTPVRDVISMIADQSGANILMAGDIEGNISLKLKQIPWDQALLLVMRTKNLGFVKQGTVLRIATMAALQKETKESKDLLDEQKKNEPLRVKVITVSYAKVADLATQVANFLSARGKATGDVRTSSLVVTDIAENLERVANLVKSLDSPPLQVLIEGRVVEARETFTRDFGIKWTSTVGSPIGGTINLAQQGGNMIGGDLKAVGGLDFGLTLGTFNFLGDLGARLALAEAQDLAHVVSAPRILAMNNEKAMITQKNSIPISEPIIDQGRVTGQNIKYKDIVLLLEVTPQVTSSSDVIMQINLKREFIGTVGVATPNIESREATSKVLVRNGDTAVIGGIYQSDATERESGVPYLRSVPVLGWLFKAKSALKQKKRIVTLFDAAYPKC